MTLSLGTNCGFLTETPVADPEDLNTACDSYILALRDTTPADCTKIIEIGWWCDSQGDEGQNWEVGIYDDSGSDSPVNLLDGADRTNTLSAGAGWKKVTGLNITVTAETIYWIGIEIDESAPTVTRYDYSSASGVGRYYYQGAESTLPDIWTDDTTSNRINSIYAVYETEAPPPTVAEAIMIHTDGFTTILYPYTP